MNDATMRLFAGVRLLVLDVDGVMTDGSVTYSADGSLGMAFYIPDGMGIVLAQRAEVKVAILTTSDNPIIRARANNLGIGYLRMGAQNKGLELPKLCADAGVTLAETAYMSDDINDCRALAQVGLPIAVANADPLVKSMARFITEKPGGKGAIREVCDLLLTSRGLDIVAVWEGGKRGARV